MSWWDWQESKSRHWTALGKPLPEISKKKSVAGYPTLKSGSKGDLVLWAQEHLVAAGQKTAVTGIFRSQTAKAVSAFRAEKGLGSGSAID